MNLNSGSIIPLEYDSELFGYPVGSIEVDNSFIKEDFIKKAREYQLVYLFSTQAMDFDIAGILPAGEKVMFSKPPKKYKSHSPNVELINDKPNKALFDLAFQSGECSRFKEDSRLRNGEFEKLYRDWVQKEYQRGDIYMINKVQGLLTISGSEQIKTIGLFAISTYQRAKGLGKELLQEIESILYERGVKELKVKTQRANQSAIRFYLNNGFVEDGSWFVYHYWNGD